MSGQQRTAGAGTGEVVLATRLVPASAEVVFDVLADPASHADIDGTGWVRGARDLEPLGAAGQVFRMAMHHPGHPDGDYEMANEVQLLERPHVISWRPGYDVGDGTLAFGGWVWRYDLEPAAQGGTEVTLSYDWSAITDEARRVQSFPPFPHDHLVGSLDRLAALATR